MPSAHITPRRPGLQAARVVVPESKLAIQDAKVIGKRLLVTFMQDAHSVCRRERGFYSFESFVQPATVYRYDFATGLSAAWQEPALPFAPSAFETKQIFFASKDGTRVPMFVTSKRGLARGGSLPTLITGYGFCPSVSRLREPYGTLPVTKITPLLRAHQHPPRRRATPRRRV